MRAAERSEAKSPEAAATRVDRATAGLAFVLLVTSILRVAVAPHRLLWLDEVWTGVLVTQPTLADFVRLCAVDVNGPLYTVMAALWAKVAGVSDFGLRSLPLVLGVSAPIIALAGRKTIDRPTRLVWSALIACWIPGIWYSQEARPYTLVLALAVANTIAFAAVLQTPGRKQAWTWTILSALLILSHYFAAILVGIQGLVFLAGHQRRALRNWSAAAAFLPVTFVVWAQSSSIISFSKPATTWIRPANITTLLDSLNYLAGVQLALFAIAIWLIVEAIFWFRDRGRAQAAPSNPPRLWLPVACSAAATLVAVALGAWKPIFIPRYLTAYEPGIVLGLALLASRFSRRRALSSLTLVILLLASDVVWAAAQDKSYTVLSWESASQALMRTSPKRVVFLWDTPMGGTPGEISGLGGFFFRRAGHAIPAYPVILHPGDDPNALLLSHGAADGSVILWIYDLSVAGTAAISHKPAIEALDPRWSCEDFGRGVLHVLACHQRPPVQHRIGPGA